MVANEVAKEGFEKHHLCVPSFHTSLFLSRKRVHWNIRSHTCLHGEDLGRTETFAAK
jgi:hypothetical protein